jgi:hypothetical protein
MGVPKNAPQHSLNRVDNDGDYTPGNIEWATDANQRKNKRPRRVFPPHLPNGRWTK